MGWEEWKALWETEKAQSLWATGWPHVFIIISQALQSFNKMVSSLNMDACKFPMLRAQSLRGYKFYFFRYTHFTGILQSLLSFLSRVPCAFVFLSNGKIQHPDLHIKNHSLSNRTTGPECTYLHYVKDFNLVCQQTETYYLYMPHVCAYTPTFIVILV